MPIQLYCYSRGAYWKDNQRAGWVADKKPRLIVVHAPQTSTQHVVYEVELEVARGLAEAAATIRGLRKAHTNKTVWRTIK